MKVLLVDHHDSFIDMIADYLKQLGAEIVLLKTDQLSLDTISQTLPNKIIIGPGPGHPLDPALDPVRKIIIQAIKHNIPVLGICLGHQIIAEYFGASVIQTENIAHGMCSKLLHDGTVLFNGLPKEFIVTRYHSLIVDTQDFNHAQLKITATTDIGEIMALQHLSFPVFGVQFHPESAMTEHGLEMLKNFLTKAI